MRQPAAVAGDDAVVGVQGVAQVVPGAAGDAGADPLVGRGQRQLDAAAVRPADGADHHSAPVALHVAQRLEHRVDQLRGALHVVVGRLEGHAAAAVAEARRGVGEHDVAVGGEELRGADHLRGVLGEPEAMGHQDRRLRVPAAGVARLVERGVEADRDVAARTGAHRHHPLGGAPAAGASGRGDVVGRRGAALGRRTGLGRRRDRRRRRRRRERGEQGGDDGERQRQPGRRGRRRGRSGTSASRHGPSVSLASTSEGPYHVSSRPETSSVGVRVNASGPSSAVKT